MKEITKHLKVIVVLILIQFLLDMLYVYIYPTVNPIRATIIGCSALIILYLISLIPYTKNLIDLKPYISFIPIYSSALFGALLVQADFVKSKSAASGIAHVVILIVTYVVIAVIKRTYEKKK
ncbi:hypothetical protein HYX00_05115 [Candidatus Woesearchaeota archaeon]|nr:hypothetical protein [Candidatus Woesearchaeota archaeon]